MKEANNYEPYRKVKTQEQYFATWDRGNAEILTGELKKKIYERYIIKCFVFQRDQFKCRNEICKAPASPLTMHHIKFQKNDGKDSVKNCITICKSCHNGFHRAKNELKFDSMTYKIHKTNELNWKLVKKQNKKLRKEIRMNFEGIVITTELFEKLMMFLMMSYEGDEDDD